MVRTLVTGGAGLIGSFLCERLLHEGQEVVCLDNFFSGRKENIAHLLGNPRFELLHHDIVNPLYLEVARIFNLASPASPAHYQSHPIKTVKANVLGVINMLGLAKRTDARILQASTSEVYGDPLEHPQTENYGGNVNPVGPRSCYEEGKRVAETLMMDYHRQHGVDVKIVRIFNTFGPRMNTGDGRVVSNFITRALRGEPLTIFGDGAQTRAFCYVSDTVDGLVRMMETNDFTGPVNLGNPGEITVLDLAHRVIDLTLSRSEIVFMPPMPDDPAHRNPDISLARKKLGWEPLVPLDAGLKRTIAHFRQEFAKNSAGRDPHPGPEPFPGTPRPEPAIPPTSPRARARSTEIRFSSAPGLPGKR